MTEAMADRPLPVGVAFAEAFTDTGAASSIRLFPEEEAYIAGAVEKRRREFTTVRGCARQALRELGRPPAPLVSEGGNGPRWPDGVVGSLTHCPGYRAAALAPADAFRAVGIDAEPDAPLPAGAAARILLPAERDALAALGRDGPPVAWDRLVFCVKEAVYKVWHPLTGRQLSFLDVEVEPRADGTFTARLRVSPPPAGGRPPEVLRGRWAARHELLTVGIAVPAPGAGTGTADGV